MKSLAKARERYLDPCCSVEMPETYCPSFYVDNKQMPEIDEWEVGEEYTIVVKVKMTSYSLSESAEKSKSSAEIELLEYDSKIPKSLT